MEKLDRHGWAAGLAFTSYGVRVGVRTNNRDVLSELEKQMPHGATRCTTPFVHRLYSLIVGGADRPNVRYFHFLYADATRMVRTTDLRDVFAPLEYDVELYIAERARGRVFVHAGAVAWNGEAIVLPGRTRTGKTTLVATLVRAGAVYYSDEYAVVDARGCVHPYPRPLSIRSETGEFSRVPVEDLGGRSGSHPVPVRTVLVTRYEAGSVWHPRPLSAGKAALQLLAHTVSVRFRPSRALAAALRVANGATNLAGVRGRADDVVAVLLGDGRG